jgi:hypothetical protein
MQLDFVGGAPGRSLGETGNRVFGRRHLGILPICVLTLTCVDALAAKLAAVEKLLGTSLPSY